MATQHDTLHSINVNPDDATPMVRQFLEVKQQYPGILLFYRMGDFYETFFEDALISARVLEITLTGRDAGKLGKIPMAGIPVKAAETYLAKLLSRNFKVAICEQVEDPALAKGLVARKVVRVLSSGTITDASLLKPEENNFLAAVVLGTRSAAGGPASDAPCGLAYCDITTGTFFVAELTYGQLLSELDRIRPSEILTQERRQKVIPGVAGISDAYPDVPPEIADNYPCSPLTALAFDVASTERALKSLLDVTTLDGFDLEGAPLALKAAGAIAYYVKETFIDQPPVFDRLHRYHLTQTVTLNAAARRNLELLTTAKLNQYEGSLLWVLNQTCTSMGARLLRHWVSQPLTDLSEIHSRLDAVEELVNAPSLRDKLRRILPEIYDIERLSAKVAHLTAQPRDLIALKHSIARLPELSSLLASLKSFYLVRMQAFPPELFKLVALIDQAVDDSPPLNLKEGGLIKGGYHGELDRLRVLVAEHEDWLQEYERQERERTGIKTLRVAYNSAFGYYIEISRASASQAPADYRRKQTLTNAERFTTDVLKAREAEVLDAQGRQYDLEYTLFLEVREKLLPYAAVLKDCAHRVAALDVLQSLATVAVEQHYTRPQVDDTPTLHLEGSRHPVVEKILPMGRFVPNDCQLSASPDADAPQVMVITGPNMAGKSTYMRQIALITLMAQMGSFVPATRAHIDLVDSIYTRVGAVDDLSSGQSTFMVEMSETAQILNGATRRSLVLLDEVGRGTSTYDGVAIAASVVEYLVNRIGCRTLFATHYHELNTLEDTYPQIRNMRVVVTETEGEIAFLHRVEPGAAQKSYGIQVARMAGVPQEVIIKASAVLAAMQKKEGARLHGGKNRGEAIETPQLTLFQ